MKRRLKSAKRMDTARDNYDQASKRRLADQRHIDGKKKRPTKSLDAGQTGTRHEQRDPASFFPQSLKKPEPDDLPIRATGGARASAARRKRLEGTII